MGRGWGEEDKVWLTNTTDSVDLFRMTNRVNYGAPIASPVSFASGDLTLEVGKTYQLGWLTETVADNTGLGTDQNPVAGFTAFSFGPGGGGSVPLPGAAGLAAIGLVGLARRRRR
jgi:MprA protease rhombosortase-interaction domain-containing protein